MLIVQAEQLGDVHLKRENVLSPSDCEAAVFSCSVLIVSAINIS